MSSNHKSLLVKAKAKHSPRSEAGTFFKTQQSREEYLADRIINILIEAGFNYDEMIEVIKLAREKYNHLLKQKKHENN